MTEPARAGIGHNSGEPEAVPGGIAAEHLHSIVERIERLMEERKALADDIKDIFAEAKSAGFNAKIIRKVIARRQMDRATREEEDTLLGTYERALGLL